MKFGGKEGMKMYKIRVMGISIQYKDIGELSRQVEVDKRAVGGSLFLALPEHRVGEMLQR